MNHPSEKKNTEAMESIYENRPKSVPPARKKTVLITGSGRGIGRAAALYFAQKAAGQWNIVINNAHDARALEDTRLQIMGCPGASCLAVRADTGSYESCRAMFETIRQTFGDPDVLVNNAGAAHIGLFTDMAPGQWERLLSTNLGSVLNCTHLAVPAMVRRQSGKIINISSVWGNTGASCEAVYSASKGGVNAFTKAMAKELGPSHIQVNAIACGLIDTEMNRGLSPEEQAALVDEIPAGRMGDPWEAAALIYDLATGHDYLTGQVITLDGGWI